MPHLPPPYTCTAKPLHNFTKFWLFVLPVLLFCQGALAQHPADKLPERSGILLTAYRVPPPAQPPVFTDLDRDGDPDLMQYKTAEGVKLLWIDDDDDMKPGDLLGDTDNDCLLADRNDDGKYASWGDVVIDWVDTNSDGKADLQLFSEFSDEVNKDKPWDYGHFMISFDLDKDDVMNYIDWHTFSLRGWVHEGQSDFFKDYSGKSAFAKIHASPQMINDLRLNWENPFLFYDPDKDGYTEMAVRLVDSPRWGTQAGEALTNLTGKINWVSMAYDLDNDNGPGNEFDYDMAISFRGEGFDYMDQRHPYKNLRGLPATDSLFLDPRIRQLTELIYPDHDRALELVFNRGKWDKVYFVYDEDDDSHRWERVEFYEPKDPWLLGVRKGGLDDNPQSDRAGDRGEWDLDNSGKGQLYISPMDGKLHLYGAEEGYWRIDQNAFSYQGMGGLYDGYGPGRQVREQAKYPHIKYTDTDRNGFFDQLAYDLDSDGTYEETVSLIALGLSDRATLIAPAEMTYEAWGKLEKRIAETMWSNALALKKIAEMQGVDTSWYARYGKPASLRQKYHFGYWLQFYLLRDISVLGNHKNDTTNLDALMKAYYSGQLKAFKK